MFLPVFVAGGKDAVCMVSFLGASHCLISPDTSHECRHNISTNTNDSSLIRYVQFDAHCMVLTKRIAAQTGEMVCTNRVKLETIRRNKQSANQNREQTMSRM